ncbi:MAG: hypothetical protein K9G75_00795 [Candidatus Nanopelagicales bacterium]|nr:hypothetical protein [Candidatus Nanopelagicales bacterium]
MTSALAMPGSFIDNLNTATSLYKHERDLVVHCTSNRFDNVVVSLAAGEVAVPPALIEPQFAGFGEVPYIIFEEASSGDARNALKNGLVVADTSWALRMLHGTANGLRQLHAAGISHQDIKPSNVMVFDHTSKVGDLGRASFGGGRGPFDAEPIAGDRTYAPPELRYEFLLQDDRARRRSADIYQLGSLVAFFFADSALSALIDSELDPVFHWSRWPQDYLSALPYVRQAFDQAMIGVAPKLPEFCRKELLQIVRELCDPDPRLRGNPRSGVGTQRYELSRYVSVFDRLAVRAEYTVKKALAAP